MLSLQNSVRPDCAGNSNAVALLKIDRRRPEKWSMPMMEAWLHACLARCCYIGHLTNTGTLEVD